MPWSALVSRDGASSSLVMQFRENGSPVQCGYSVSGSTPACHAGSAGSNPVIRSIFVVNNYNNKQHPVDTAVIDWVLLPFCGTRGSSCGYYRLTSFSHTPTVCCTSTRRREARIACSHSPESLHAMGCGVLLRLCFVVALPCVAGNLL